MFPRFKLEGISRNHFPRNALCKIMLKMKYPTSSFSHRIAARCYTPAKALRARAQAQIARTDAETQFSPALIDSFQRRHNYLRISLTERCNLRCFYCMPSDGVELSPREHILTDDEIIRLATLFVKSGVTKIRLTGGEPTVRKTLSDIIGRLNELRPLGLESICMTSNGLSLHRRLPDLIANGLSHLNLSLDTLDSFKFEIMARRPGHDAVLRSLEVALASPLQSIKLNVVVVKGLNDSEVLDFVEMTRDRNMSVRFIEFMPFTGNKWDKAKMVPSSELLERVMERFPNLLRNSDELNDTTRSYRVPGYKGSIGFISSMSDHFCASCNRLRITADGQIKVCLFDPKEISLRDEMRRGASDSELLQIIGRAVSGKKEKHAGMEDIDVVMNRPMILIGDVKQHNSRIMRRLLTPLRMDHRQVWPPRSLIQARDTQHAEQHRWYSRSAGASSPRLTHVDINGRPTMVDVDNKEPSRRNATAVGYIYIPKVAYDLIASVDPLDVSEDTSALDKAKAKARKKGDVLTVAQLAAIMGSKRTSDLIPLCHPLLLTNVSVTLVIESRCQDQYHPGDELHDRFSTTDTQHRIRCTATVSCDGKTGVEMEALTAVSVGLLTVWDMLKAVAGRDMIIGDIHVSHKEGGKSDFSRTLHDSMVDDWHK